MPSSQLVVCSDKNRFDSNTKNLNKIKIKKSICHLYKIHDFSQKSNSIGWLCRIINAFVNSKHKIYKKKGGH